MKHFLLHTQKFLELSSLEYNDIFLTKVSSVDNNVNHLFSYIKITTTAGNTTKVTPFHPSSFFTPYHKQAVTSDFIVCLRDCRNKSILIENSENFELSFFYKQAEFRIDSLIINVAKQINGWNFSLNPENSDKVRSKFPKAIPSRSIFITEDVRLSFEIMHGPVFYHMISALTGLDTDELIFVKDISFYYNEKSRKIMTVYFDYTGSYGERY